MGENGLNFERSAKNSRTI